MKLKLLRKGIEYMLANNIIEPSAGEWSSPCALVPKKYGTFRFCTDYRMLNSKTKSDSFTMPRIDDCIDHIGGAKYVSKLDLLKGYWQKLINTITSGLVGCEAYLDDIVVYSGTWEDHLAQMRSLFDRLTDANLTVNLSKCEFAQAQVSFLGHVVGHGCIKPVEAKVETIMNFPVPDGKRALRRFLDIAGYYRKFCPNFADVAAPLTNLLRKNIRYEWTPDSPK